MCTFDHLLLFRDPSGFALVLEQSPDMVPGMLHSRFRPGLNHVAFTLPTPETLEVVRRRGAAARLVHHDR